MADVIQSTPVRSAIDYHDGYTDALLEQLDDAIRRLIVVGKTEQEIKDRVAFAFNGVFHTNPVI